MELLSYISRLPTRRETLQDRASDLVSEFKTLSKMEAEMAERTEALVYRLRHDKIGLEEFKRVAADETVTAALAGFMLGNKPKKISDTSFAKASQALPYLWKFFAAIAESLGNGRLNNDDYEEIASGELVALLEAYDGMLDDDTIQEILDQIPTQEMGLSVPGASTPASWEGVESRLARYLVTPMYGAMAGGEMMAALQGGNTMMQRVSRHDRRTCEDCNMYDSMGWMPIGALPPPGERCRCHDRCRCYLNFR
tara:strand:- start:2084 stop:2842 length:759 start_codon:yes stop_codon:yes gene_type:complete